jgi:flagellar biosynthesis protein FlhB
MENTDTSSKTELPTEKRLEELRRLGQIHFSTEFATSVAFLLCIIILFIVLKSLTNSLSSLVIAVLSTPLRADQNFLEIVTAIVPNLTSISASVLPFLFVAPLTIAGLILLQTNFNIRENWAELKFQLLNPVNGFNRIFSLQNLFNFAKSIAKILVFITVFFFFTKDDFNFSFKSSLNFFTELQNLKFQTFKVLAIGAVVLLIFGIIDIFVGYFLWLRQNMMTKQEVKDDYKATEGDPFVKKRVQQKHSKLIKKVKQEVKKSTVVITNPTHYAVALRYERFKDAAPVVTAKGIDFMAERIKSFAREFEIPIVERPALARLLYRNTKVGQMIPKILFRAVAEVLAYIYRLKHKDVHTQV